MVRPLLPSIVHHAHSLAPTRVQAIEIALAAHTETDDIYDLWKVGVGEFCP